MYNTANIPHFLLKAESAEADADNALDVTVVKAWQHIHTHRPPQAAKAHCLRFWVQP